MTQTLASHIPKRADLWKVFDRVCDDGLWQIMGIQARSKQCLIGPAITKLSAGDQGAG